MICLRIHTEHYYLLHYCQTNSFNFYLQLPFSSPSLPPPLFLSLFILCIHTDTQLLSHVWSSLCASTIHTLYVFIYIQTHKQFIYDCFFSWIGSKSLFWHFAPPYYLNSSLLVTLFLPLRQKTFSTIEDILAISNLYFTPWFCMYCTSSWNFPNHSLHKVKWYWPFKAEFSAPLPQGWVLTHLFLTLSMAIINDPLFVVSFKLVNIPLSLFQSLILCNPQFSKWGSDNAPK